MAKQTQDREDLLRDASAMPFRGRTVVDGTEVFAGFRSAGQFSLYWGQDPVFQFGRDGSLRRVFVDSKRYSAEKSTLVCLVRSKGDVGSAGNRLSLTRQPLGEEDQARVIASIEDHLRKLRSLLDESTHRWDVVGETEDDFVKRVAEALETIGHSIRIAAAANA